MDLQKYRMDKRVKRIWRLGRLLVLLLFVLSENVLGNNVRIEGTPRLKLVGSEVHISFNLSFNLSWRDDFNWDAVWLFVKYSD